MPFLKHSVNGSMVSIYDIQNEANIGRQADNHIVIDDPTISQLHAKVQLIGGDWLVLDCASTNGIRVNGKVQTQSTLVDGSIFTLGTQEFEFCIVAPNQFDQTLKIKKTWIPGVYYTE